MRTLKVVSTWLLTLTLGSVAQAAGFQVDVHGARATGMATAVTADVSDASAIFYNAAGIAQGAGIDLYVGDTLLIPSVRFQDTAGVVTHNEAQVIPPPHVYLVLGWDDMWSFGLGLFEPYGSAMKWPSGWEGDAVTHSVRLATYYINPTVGFRLGNLRLGAGLQIVRGTLSLVQGLVLPGEPEGFIQAGLGAWGVGGNAGIQYDVIPDLLTVGASYRSAVRLNFSGDVAFQHVAPELGSTFPDQSLSTRLTMPDIVGVGISVKPLEKLKVNVDAVYTAWQHFRGLPLTFSTTSLLNQTVPKDWSYGISVHVGSEYQLNETWDLRAGVMYDPSASPDSTLGPDIPDTTRVNLAAGLGYHWGPLRFDLGYQYIILTSATSTLPPLSGQYSGNAQVLGLSVGLHI